MTAKAWLGLIALLIYLFTIPYCLSDSCEWCNSATAIDSGKWPQLLVKDGSQIVAEAPIDFYFDESSKNLVAKDEANSAFNLLMNYCRTHPDHELTITGSSHRSEKGKDLGLDRAKDVMERLVMLGANRALIKPKGGGASDPVLMDGKTFNALDFKWTEIVREYSLAINDGAAFRANAGASGGNIRFAKGTADMILPVGEKVEGLLNRTGMYLAGNEDRSLRLTGYHLQGETNSKLLPLGQQRANSLKNYLVNLGAPAAQISTAGEELSKLKFRDDILFGGVSYDFFDSGARDYERLTAIEKRFKAAPLVLYFETAKDQLVLDSKTRSDFSDLLYYLDAKPKAALSVVGHTDSQGSRSTNIALSKNRAAFVKGKMVENGMKGSQLKSSGKGPDVPVSSNDTDKGRALNRRVEVRL